MTVLNAELQFYMLILAVYITNSVGIVDQRDSVGSWIPFHYKSEILWGRTRHDIGISISYQEKIRQTQNA